MKLFSTLKWYGYLIVGVPALFILTIIGAVILKSETPILRQENKRQVVMDTIKIEIKETVYDTIHIKVYDTVPVKPKEVTKKVIIDSTEVTQVIQE